MKLEIRVALLGHVSVGKTTLLNALLGDKFSEVSMKRTTAGINHFKVSTLTKDTNDDAMDIAADDEDVTSASKALETITQENSQLRAENRIQERTFEVELDKSLVPMRDNTNLVITDIPGVNEAGTSDMYLKWVRESWHSFDCVIVVMDANQGVNTEEKVSLLKSVQENNKERKSIPIIVLCNKVDDPEDEELMGLVDEVRSKVEGIFNVKGTQRVLNQLEKNQVVRNLPKAFFLPLSAENAFLYRAVETVKSSNELKNLDSAYVDKIGQEEVGKFKWKKLSKKRKLEAVYEVVANKEEYKERLASTNFDKLLLLLNRLIGGKPNQTKLIKAQLDIRMKRLSSKGAFASDLSSIYDMSALVGRSVQCSLHLKFWKLVDECQDRAMKSLEVGPSKRYLKEIHELMDQLEEYLTGLHLKLFKDEERRDADKEKLQEAMANLFRKQCQLIVEKFQSYSFHPNKKAYQYNQNGTIKCDKNGNYLYDEVWNNVPARDKSKIISSILIMRGNKFFYENFSKEIDELDWYNMKELSNDSGKHCSNITIPSTPADREHWGHLAWRFCEFMEKSSKAQE